VNLSRRSAISFVYYDLYLLSSFSLSLVSPPRQHAPVHSPTFNDDCVYRQTTPFSLLPLLIATPFLRSPPPYFDFDTCYVCTTRSWSNANHAQISWRNGRGGCSIKTIDPPYWIRNVVGRVRTMIAIPCQKDKENVEKRISSCCCVLLRVKFRRLTNIILTPSDRQMALARRNCRVIFFSTICCTPSSQMVYYRVGGRLAVIKNAYFFIWTCSWCRLDVSLYDVIYPAVRYSFERCHENDYYIFPQLRLVLCV
jgi:hypothetical protein